MNRLDAHVALRSLGYRSEANPPASIKDPDWRADVRRFQADHGLEVDGWYGEGTDTALRGKAEALAAARAKFPELGDLRRWRTTAYWFVQASAGGGVPVYGQDGGRLAFLTTNDFVSAALEGTVELPDGR